MASSNPSDSPVTIELDDGCEGEHVGSTDYFFVKIGDAVPLMANDFTFDLQSLPCTPLAVSERFGLIFVAHSSGFFVARTNDVMDSAKEFKEKGNGSPIQQLSLADVSIGKVHVLALSTDNSIVAASVSGDIRFYSVDNLLSKDVKQSFSCSLNELSHVKDMRWKTTSEKSFIVLSNVGKLYYGEVDFPLKEVMANVDAVEWSAEGKSVAVARMNVISILSANFEERISITLSFRSWTSDSGESCHVKVDSVKWVRPDSIVIGSFQLSGDGKEENYLLQVIKSRDGEVIDVHSQLIVQSFYDIYQGLFDDIVPVACGPHLLLAYLKQCQLAINANRKNTDEHIVLLGWSVDDKSEAVVVDIDRDNWVPRIELQENGDDNLVLGLCIDSVSVYEKVSVQLGVEERTELTPYCVLICLTLDGKLVMFNVASSARSEASAEVVSVVPDEEKDAPSKIPLEECSTLSHGMQKQELEQASEVAGNIRQLADRSQETRNEDIFKSQEVKSMANVPSLKPDEQQMVSNEEKDAPSKIPLEECSTLSHGMQKQELEQAPEVSGNLKIRQLADPSQETRNEDIFKSQEVKSMANVPSLKPDEQRMLSNINPNLEPNGQNTYLSPEHNTMLGQFPSSASLEIPSRAETQKIKGIGFSSGSSKMTSPTTSVFPSLNNLQESTQTTNELLSKNRSRHSLISSHQSTGNVNINIVKDHTRHGQKPFDVLDTDGALPTVNYTSRPVQNVGQKVSKGAGNMEMLSFRTPHLPLNESSIFEKSSIQKFRGNEQHRSSTLGISASELNLSKHFGNIHEMTMELDLLLRSIEEAGGFTDTCTSSLLSPVEGLERGMGTLSENSKTWMYQVTEQLEEVHSLLDKTIQVVARKMYMEGIFKQAFDSQYWDLWNRQKLNSELELKQQHILSLNQDLTNQLIELERHFNVLEFNTFSESGATHVDHAALQNRSRPSRHIQSLCSVHNAMNSQLVAAENLSESLSKQMASLSIKSPSEEQKTVRELFETIGIPYQPSFGSTDMKNGINTPSSKKSVLSNLATNKDQSKKNQASAFKGCEPEMSRRRRDSLDQSWTCSEPPKTIVRRMLLQDVKRSNKATSIFSMDKENMDLSFPKKSPHQTDSRNPSTIFTAFEQRGIQVSHPEDVPEHAKALISANNLSTPTQISEPKYTMLPRNNISSRHGSHLSPAIMQRQLNDSQDFTNKRHNAVVEKFSSISNSENKPISHMKGPQNSSVSNYPSSDIPFLSKSSEISGSTDKMTMFTSSKIENKSSTSANSESWRMQDSVFSTSSTIPPNSHLFGKSAHSNIDKSHPGGVLAVPSFGGLCDSSSQTIQTPLTSPSFSSISSTTVPSAPVSVDLSRSSTKSSTIQVESTSSTSALPSDQAPKHVPSSFYPPSFNLNLEPPKSEVQQVVISNSKTDLETKDVNTLLVEPLNNEAKLVEPPNNETKSEPKASENSSPSSAGSSAQSTSNVTCSVSSNISVSQPEQRADAPMQIPTFPPSSVTSGKTPNLDATITDEDEMEEEAPEMSSNSSEPNFPSFGGFGIGTIPNPSTAKSNPFGGPFGVGGASSPGPPMAFSVPSGELFRPASFTFPSSQPSAPAQSTNSGAFSGGFSAMTSVSATPQSAFGQPAQVGSGQQALGSVLGSFGQSRQLGNGLPGSGFAAPSGFGGGFGVTSSAGGFSSASPPAGGFAGMSSTGGGFAGVASSGVGFSGVASSFGGFAGNASSGGPAGGGFAAVAGGFAGAASGGGFGGFGSQGSGFGAFGAGGGTSKPPDIFTQMRK